MEGRLAVLVREILDAPHQRGEGGVALFQNWSENLLLRDAQFLALGDNPARVLRGVNRIRCALGRSWS